MEFLEKISKFIPEIQSQELKGGIVYYDGQFNDSRMNVSIILTALESGAVASNYVEFVGFEKNHLYSFIYTTFFCLSVHPGHAAG